jgi:hypothetical protein
VVSPHRQWDSHSHSHSHRDKGLNRVNPVASVSVTTTNRIHNNNLLEVLVVDQYQLLEQNNISQVAVRAGHMSLLVDVPMLVLVMVLVVIVLVVVGLG